MTDNLGEPGTSRPSSETLTVSVRRPVRAVVAPGCVCSVRPVFDAPGTALEDTTPALIEPIDRIAEELRELQQRHRTSLQELQELAVEIAVHVAQRVVRTAIDRDQMGIDAMVEEIVATLRPEEVLWIQLHPDDLKLISATLKQHGVQGTTVRFKANSEIVRGECRAETSQVCLTSSLAAQLSQIRMNLLQNLQHAQTERRQTEDTSPLLQRFPDRRATG